jgi:CRP-like cAMP-binding protein
MNHRLVSSIPLFSGIPRRHHMAVAALVDEIDVPPGKTLVREGAYGRELFVIVDGSAEVRTGSTETSVLGRGHFFGELGAIELRPRTATVVARSAPLRLLVIGPRELVSLMLRFPSVDQRVRAALVSRGAAVERRASEAVGA